MAQPNVINVVDKYFTQADKIEVEVRIHKYGRRAAFYELIVFDFGPGTEALMDQIRQEIVLEVDINTTEVLEAHLVKSLKEKYISKKSIAQLKTLIGTKAGENIEK